MRSGCASSSVPPDSRSRARGPRAAESAGRAELEGLPTQLRDASALNHRTDLYALGVTFFELATGSLPIRDGDMAYHHRHSPAPDPREFASGVPDELARLILQMLEKRRQDRPANASAVAARLQPILSALL